MPSGWIDPRELIFCMLDETYLSDWNQAQFTTKLRTCEFRLQTDPQATRVHIYTWYWLTLFNSSGLRKCTSIILQLASRITESQQSPS